MLKKLKIIIIGFLIINALSVSILIISKGQTSENKRTSSIDTKATYYLEGKGDKWQFNDGVLIYDSGKCFFANGLLKNISTEKITLKSNKIVIEEKNTKNEVVSNLFSRVVANEIIDTSGNKQYSYEENVEPYRSIQIFEGLNIKQDAIHFKDIIHDDLFLVFEYTGIDDVKYKEEFKLKKEIFTWN